MRRIVHIASLGFLGLVFVVPATVLLPTVGTAQAQDAVQQSAILRIAAVLALKERGTFDPRLEPLRPELRRMPFRSYSLLATRSCRVKRSQISSAIGFPCSIM